MDLILGFEEDTDDVGDGDVEVMEVVEVDEGVVTFEPPVEVV